MDFEHFIISFVIAMAILCFVAFIVGVLSFATVGQIIVVGGVIAITLILTSIIYVCTK